MVIEIIFYPMKRKKEVLKAKFGVSGIGKILFFKILGEDHPSLRSPVRHTVSDLHVPENCNP
jgi:hypothetical protein